MIGMKILLAEAEATVRKLHHIQNKMETALDTAVLHEAHDLRGRILVGIVQQAPGGVLFKPLDPKTIAMRKKKGIGSTKALIDDGDMVRSVTVQQVAKSMFFVGVHKSAIDKQGNTIANLAEVHEYGTKDGHVPARPFMQPSFDMWRKELDKRLMARVLKILGWDKLRNMGNGLPPKVMTDTMTSSGPGFSGSVQASHSGGSIGFTV